ncbi:MAG: glycosyltransferase [Bacteroidales bacterium]|nr:glycosyltransferase [Bacteroidales bacterium]
MIKAILSVTNDLYTDPRVDKVARFLQRNGYQVTLVGRRYGDSPSLEERPYQTHRLRLLFRRGPLFYAEYQLRLFLFLLFHRFDVYVANDLDTLLPNFLISRMRKKRLVYDSHEYFCGELSVVSNSASLWVWSHIEKFCFPKLETVITVSQSIVDQYEKEYGIRPYLVRNIPPQRKVEVTETRTSLGMPEDKFVLILQGNAINEGRGGEEMIEAMPLLPDTHLFVVGGGLSLPAMKQRAKELNVADNITFVGRQNQQMLYNYTVLSDAGIALDRDLSANLRFSLPNKIFEYIKAGTPLVVSNLVERRHIVEQYQVGVVAEDWTPENIAAAVRQLMDDPDFFRQCQEHCITAAQELTWENEEKVLAEIYATSPSLT